MDATELELRRIMAAMLDKQKEQGEKVEQLEGDVWALTERLKEVEDLVKRLAAQGPSAIIADGRPG